MATSRFSLLDRGCKLLLKKPGYVLRIFPMWKMADAGHDDALVPSREVVGLLLGTLWKIASVSSALDIDGGYGNLRLGRCVQLGLCLGVRPLT